MEKNYSQKKFEEKFLLFKINFFELFNIKDKKNIFNFLNWFNDKIIINFNKNTPNLKLKKGEIYFINLGINIGSELNKQRPCLIFSDWFFNNGKTVVIIPLKSYEGKKYNKNINIFIKKSKINNLKENSMADLSGIRQVSKKRIGLFIGNIEEGDLLKINKKLTKFLGLKKQTVN
ncbi:type II toxin-antitoxin system PemK/MazF family toxin [Candidatus Gracilibacteria bacterium]|nr:type II toxin-antitoxin system PemK/MazF family toxin [Candidatus Gracilibacteria bacterium]